MEEKEVQRLVEELSLKFFGKKFRHKAYFNPRLKTTGGRYLLNTHNIELNRKSYELYGIEELEGIMKHELVHYHLHLEGKGYKHGDEDFKMLLRKVNAPRYCKSVTQIKRTKREVTYTYQCVGCSLLFTRKRRMDVNKYRCGKCYSKIIYI